MTREVSDKKVTGKSSTDFLRCHLRLTPTQGSTPPPPLRADEVFTQLTSLESKFPVLRPAAVAALQLLHDPNATIDRLSSVIEEDLTLEVEIVRIANSSVFSNGSPISVLAQVPARFGFDKCMSLIEIASLSLMLRSIPMSQSWVQQNLWFHGFLTATICSDLNQLLKLDGNGEEFRCGLLHDVGRQLVGAVAPCHFEFVDHMDFEEPANQLEQERSIVGLDHCEVGAWFAARHGLPLQIISVTRHHHNPRLAEEHRLMVALVQMADHMANHLQRHDTSTGYDPGTNPAVELMFRNDAHRRCLFLASAVAVMNKSLRSARLVATI